MRDRLRKAGDVLAALVYVAVLSLPPRPPSPARQREIDLSVAVARSRMFAQLYRLDAAFHAGEARGYAELAAHHAGLARKSYRRMWVAAGLASFAGAYAGYQVASWLG
jgi:hypothetical protein